jgi:hypothetical protein
MPSNSTTDDTSRKTVTVIERFRFLHRVISSDGSTNLATPFYSQGRSSGSQRQNFFGHSLIAYRMIAPPNFPAKRHFRTSSKEKRISPVSFSGAFVKNERR